MLQARSSKAQILGLANAGGDTIIGLQNFLADRAGSWVKVTIGSIFVICVVAFRRGFVGELLAWQQRRRER